MLRRRPHRGRGPSQNPFVDASPIGQRTLDPEVEPPLEVAHDRDLCPGLKEEVPGGRPRRRTSSWSGVIVLVPVPTPPLGDELTPPTDGPTTTGERGRRPITLEVVTPSGPRRTPRPVPVPEVTYPGPTPRTRPVRHRVVGVDVRPLAGVRGPLSRRETSGTRRVLGYPRMLHPLRTPRDTPLDPRARTDRGVGVGGRGTTTEGRRPREPPVTPGLSRTLP